MCAVNIAFRGGMLRYALDLVEPVVVVSEGELAGRLPDVDSTVPVVDPARLARGPVTPPELERPIGLWDIHCITLTSGTTGPSKASLTSYLQLYVTGSFATVESGLDEHDTFLIDLPLYHQAGLAMASSCLGCRTKLAVRRTPSLSHYWKVAKETGATVSFLLSSMGAVLLARPESPEEQDHKLRYLVLSPPPTDPEAVLKRFGVTDYITAYGSTEISGPTVRLPGTPAVPGSIGRERPGYEIRLVDEHDLEVPEGEPGEIVVRTQWPWMLSAGYVKDPASTAAVWRNGWFHSGDLARRDEDGNYFFHDRLKDCVRRRGENVSSFEVEREVLGHPAVAEVACVPVRADPGVDDEVKVWMVPVEGGEPDFEEMVRYLAARMPHFMIPRYYELIEVLPRTETMRVQKHALRDRGNSDRTWDLEQHGLRITRNGLVEI
jgi:crotonobetaine/carnitine-CoA ligase